MTCNGSSNYKKTKEKIQDWKYHTHEKKVGHNLEIPFDIYWWTLKNPKNQNFEKWKQKLLEISSFYRCVPKTTITRYSSWYTEWNRIFCHFRSFFPCSIPPPPPNRPEKQTSETMKRASADVIILNLWNKKHDHIIYAYSDMKCNNFFVF